MPQWVMPRHSWKPRELSVTCRHSALTDHHIHLKWVQTFPNSLRQSGEKSVESSHWAQTVFDVPTLGEGRFFSNVVSISSTKSLPWQITSDASWADLAAIFYNFDSSRIKSILGHIWYIVTDICSLTRKNQQGQQSQWICFICKVFRPHVTHVQHTFHNVHSSRIKSILAKLGQAGPGHL